MRRYIERKRERQRERRRRSRETDKKITEEIKERLILTLKHFCLEKLKRLFCSNFPA